jgi:hypothetical protein
MIEYSSTYDEARTRFLDAAEASGARLESFRNPHGDGPAGQPLCTDVAVVGPPHPAALLMCVSGTHGIEGFAGSAIQTGLLRAGIRPAATAVVFVHALNPYGFAYQRRVNEDNVDVNRNFVDHRRPPGSDGYAEVHQALVPDSWDRAGREQADARLGEYAASNGMRALQAIVTGGQWTHPDGLFYGGSEPVWSHRTLREIARRYLPGPAHIGYIDLHTGLGEAARGEPIFRGGSDPDAFARARAWYGDELTSSGDGSASSTPITGNTASLVAQCIDPGQLLTAITLEFGTLSGLEVLTALRGDNWLYLHPQPPGPRAEAIKQAIRAAFYPDDPGWRDAIWQRAITVFGQAWHGLTGQAEDAWRSGSGSGSGQVRSGAVRGA